MTTEPLYVWCGEHHEHGRHEWLTNGVRRANCPGVGPSTWDRLFELAAEVARLVCVRDVAHVDDREARRELDLAANELGHLLQLPEPEFENLWRGDDTLGARRENHVLDAALRKTEWNETHDDKAVLTPSQVKALADADICPGPPYCSCDRKAGRSHSGPISG